MRAQEVKAKLNIESLNFWKVSGELSYSSVSVVEKKTIVTRKKFLLAKCSQLSIDIGNVHHIDSAGLSWLLDNIYFSNQHKIMLKIINFKQEGAIELAKAQGIENILQQFIA